MVCVCVSSSEKPVIHVKRDSLLGQKNTQDPSVAEFKWDSFNEYDNYYSLKHLMVLSCRQLSVEKKIAFFCQLCQKKYHCKNLNIQRALWAPLFFFSEGWV